MDLRSLGVWRADWNGESRNSGGWVQHNDACLFCSVLLCSVLFLPKRACQKKRDETRADLL